MTQEWPWQFTVVFGLVFSAVGLVGLVRGRLLLAHYFPPLQNAKWSDRTKVRVFSAGCLLVGLLALWSLR